MSYIKNEARFLLDAGLLFEINRKVLHPLGLAMVIEVDDSNRRKVKISGILKTDDSEGFLYDEETFKEGQQKYQEFLEREGSAALASRQAKTGFIVQESGK